MTVNRAGYLIAMSIDRDDVDRVREAAKLTGEPDEQAIREKDDELERADERRRREVDRAEKELRRTEE